MFFYLCLYFIKDECLHCGQLKSTSYLLQVNMSQSPRSPMTNGGYKYSSVEEAQEANREKTNETHKQNREQYNAYQREQQCKLREQKKKYEQISSNPLFLIM